MDIKNSIIDLNLFSENKTRKRAHNHYLVIYPFYNCRKQLENTTKLPKVFHTATSQVSLGGSLKIGSKTSSLLP